jgi:hypothetical protein
MSVRTRIASLTVALLTVGAGLTAAPVAAAPAGWTGPTPVPGSAGEANPLAATAPDGADLLLWTVAGAVSPNNVVRAKLRPAGSDHWVRIPSPMVDKPYGGAVAIAPTRSGDFWVVFAWYTPSDHPEAFVSRLDADTRRWTTLTRVFHDADYGHESPSIAVSDSGELFVSAIAAPHVSSSPPVYRAEVATMRPGSGWRTRFLTPANRFALPMNIVANSRGQAAVSIIQGYDLSAKRVRVATRDAGAKARWKVSDLSVAGDAQKAYTAIGRDGTAAVEWTSPANGAVTVRLATRRIGTLEPWLFGDAVTGGPGTNNATYPVVSPDGSVTALWETFTNPNSLLYARQMADGVWGTATPFSTSGMRGVLDAARLRPDGTVAVLYQQYSGGLATEGLRYEVLDHGVPGGAVTLTDAGDGTVNSASLGVDAAYGNHVLWTRGDYPATDFATMADSAGHPVAMTSASSGVIARKATVKGRARVGHRVVCRTGYWVETTGVAYRWFRGKSPIPGATARTYRLTTSDRLHSLSCRVTATSDFGVRVLKSPARTVR